MEETEGMKIDGGHNQQKVGTSEDVSSFLLIFSLSGFRRTKETKKLAEQKPPHKDE